MYYSLDVEVLMNCVEQAVTQFGLVKFQNSTGISFDAFLQLIRLYLRSTLVEHKGKIFTQKSGVCIGSCLAPVLSEIYLSAVDVAVKRELSVATPGTKIFRYVDDYLLLHDRNVSPASIEQVFSRHSRGLTFTKEEPAADGLQFLDLRLQPTPSGLCWSFQQRSQKPVLPFASHHSKNVKSGIVNSLLSSSCTKSCPDLSNASLTNQINRIKKAGYPRDLIATTLKALISKSSLDRKKPPRPKKFSVTPYYQKTSHRLRAVARRYDVDVVFSCQFKLGSMCRLVNEPPPIQSGCSKKHGTSFVPSLVFVCATVAEGLKAGLSAEYVVYPRLLEARGMNGEKLLHIDEKLTLRLEKSSVVAKNLVVSTLNVDGQVDTLVDGREVEKDIYHDKSQMAAVSVTEKDGAVEVSGALGHTLRIAPLPLMGRSEDGQIAHKVFEIEEPAQYKTDYIG
ncbi:uncharacterized protein ISCGN_019135 [Ixodes scapularis]